MQIRYILILAILLFQTTCAFTTSSAKGFDPEDTYRFSAGIDIAKPLIALGLEQRAFTAYAHYGFSKYIGASINLGFESSPFKLLENNVYSSYNSQFLELWLDIKVLPRFWFSGATFFGASNDKFEATLQQVNFYPVTRTINQKQNMFGLVGRMSYYENLTDRIAANFVMDMGIIGDVENQDFRSLSSPGFIFGSGRIVYISLGLHVGYRFGLREEN